MKPTPLPQPAVAPAGTTPRRALMLIGSAKPRGSSTSESLADTLADYLSARGVGVEIAHAHTAGPDSRWLIDTLETIDLIVLATPLYFDALPSHVVEALTHVAAARRARVVPRRTSFAAIINCGTPDARQARTARDICALVARDAGFAWRGSLAFAQGEAIRGRHPARVGSKRLDASLALAAEALSRDEVIPETAVELAARPLMPERRYAILANAGWVIAARGEGVMLSMGAKPFAKGKRPPEP